MHTQILKTFNENNKEPNLLVCNRNPGTHEGENHQFNHPTLHSESETSLGNEEHMNGMGKGRYKNAGRSNTGILTQDREK